LRVLTGPSARISGDELVLLEFTHRVFAIVVPLAVIAVTVPSIRAGGVKRKLAVLGLALLLVQIGMGGARPYGVEGGAGGGAHGPCELGIGDLLDAGSCDHLGGEVMKRWRLLRASSECRIFEFIIALPRMCHGQTTSCFLRDLSYLQVSIPFEARC